MRKVYVRSFPMSTVFSTAGVAEVEKEILELTNRLREVEMERDILKKAALIKGCGSLPDTSLLTARKSIIL